MATPRSCTAQAGRVEDGDLVVPCPAFLFAREDAAELGHAVLSERARLDRARDVAVVARLLPFVDDDSGAGELVDRDLGLSRARRRP